MITPPTSTVARAVGVVALVPLVSLLAGGCAIDADDIPRDVPADERSLALASEGSAAAGGERIYLVGPGDDRLLRSVPRDAATRDELIRILLGGPNDEEIADQYTSVIPPSTELRSIRTQGEVLTIDLSGDLTELTPAGLVQAIAQIVYTASEIEGVQTVRIELDGEPQEWPTADGSTRVDLRVYDYPGFVQSAQPAFPAAPATPTG